MYRFDNIRFNKLYYTRADSPITGLHNLLITNMNDHCARGRNTIVLEIAGGLNHLFRRINFSILGHVM